MSAPSSVSRNSEFLRNLNSISDLNNLKTLLKEATDDQLLTIVEICYNLIKFRYILSKSQLNILRKFAPQIRRISKIRSRVKAEQFLLSQPKKFYSNLFSPLFKKL